MMWFVEYIGRPAAKLQLLTLGTSKQLRQRAASKLAVAWRGTNKTHIMLARGDGAPEKGENPVETSVDVDVDINGDSSAIVRLI